MNAQRRNRFGPFDEEPRSMLQKKSFSIYRKLTRHFLQSKNMGSEEGNMSAELIAPDPLGFGKYKKEI